MARATTKTFIKLRELEEPIIVLINYDFEINLISKGLYIIKKLSIGTEHRWMIRSTYDIKKI